MYDFSIPSIMIHVYFTFKWHCIFNKLQKSLVRVTRDCHFYNLLFLQNFNLSLSSYVCHFVRAWTTYNCANNVQLGHLPITSRSNLRREKKKYQPSSFSIGSPFWRNASLRSFRGLRVASAWLLSFYNPQWSLLFVKLRA